MPETRTKFEYEIRVLDKFRKPIRALLKEHNVPERDHDYYWLIIHWVTKGLVESYHREYLATRKPPKCREWFCRLYSKIMDTAMGHKYIEVFENLKNWGVLMRGSSYCKATGTTPGMSKAVWFGEGYGWMLKEYCYARDVAHLYGRGDFHAGRMMAVKLRSKILLKRLQKCAEDRKRIQLMDPVVRDAHENLKHFHIDRAKARRALVKAGVEGRKLDRELRKVDRFNDAEGSDTSLYVVRDDYGRVHTNITQVKREVRESALTCDGGPVAEVDIKSSQGAFLCYIIGACLRGDKAMLGRNGESFIAMDPAAPDWIGREQLSREFADFRGKLERRELYEFFASEMSQDFDLDEVVDRERAKKAFLATLFAGVHLDDGCDPAWHACRRVWEEHWPKLLILIDSMKVSNYRALAYEMQRMESSFVFDVVIPAIKDEIGCPYCTVHDEVIVPREFGDAAKVILDRELDRFGIPTTTVEERAILEPDDAMVEAEMASFYEVGYYCGWGDDADRRIADEYANAVS